jgi:dolichol kinase
MFQRFTIRVKGTTGLVIAGVLILIVLIAFPAYRVFFIISVGIGLIVAVILRFRNKYRPVRDKDVENKRPLGLD